MKFDHLVFLGYGAPEKPEDLNGYFEERMKEYPMKPERLEEVLRHYRAIGGYSPYNAEVKDFVARVMTQHETGGGHSVLPHFLALRFSRPSFEEVLSDIREKKFKCGRVLVLTPFNCQWSDSFYRQAWERAKSGLGMNDVIYEYESVPLTHPLAIQAMAEELEEILPLFPDQEAAPVIFTAHSIPLTAPDLAVYRNQTANSAAHVAARLKLTNSCMAYQSQSGSESAWLGPGLHQVLETLSRTGNPSVALAPIGFLFENAEVLFDLDIEFREAAERLGIRYARARTLSRNERFIRMVKNLLSKGEDEPCIRF